MAQEAKEDSTIVTSLSYPEPIIIDAATDHSATVIWIHGLGDTGNGWKADMMAISKLFPYIKFILPTAPLRAITCNNGTVMNGWYDIESIEDRDKNQYDGKEESSKYIHSLIQDEITSSKISSDRIIVGGFSQGGAMSIYCGVSCKEKIAAMICCSGYLLDFAMDEKMVSKFGNYDTPIFMFHAKKDMVVPTEYARKSYKHLAKIMNGNVEWNEYNIKSNGGHNVTQQEMDDVVDKIKTYLPK